MEQGKPQTKNIGCKFIEICSGSISCKECSESGLHYLAEKFYVPRTGIPARFDKNLFDLELTGSTGLVLDYTRKLQENVADGEGLYLYSAIPGTGKTTVACAILFRYLGYSIVRDPSNVDNRRVLYINLSEFLERIRQSFNKPDYELNFLLEELQSPGLAPELVLFDDIGADRITPWVGKRLYDLINFRYANKLACLYTSNLTLRELEYEFEDSRAGHRIVSRIRGSCRIIPFGGLDWRR